MKGYRISPAERELIRSCAENGVGIECLPSGYFRFEPVERSRDPYTGRDTRPPSGRGTVACGKGNPLNLKNWAPAKLSLNPQYSIGMRGDAPALTKARRAWSEGDPSLLRDYLREQADARRAIIAELFEAA